MAEPLFKGMSRRSFIGMAGMAGLTLAGAGAMTSSALAEGSASGSASAASGSASTSASASASASGSASASASASGSAAAPVATDAPAWLGTAPAVAASDIAETVDTDLLIVGAGNGGMAAAATAADLGLDFIICEKGDAVQSTRHWFGAVNSSYTEAAGTPVDTGRLLNEFSRYSSGLCDQKVIRVWINESASVVDWIDPILTAAGMTCEFDTEMGTDTGGTAYYVPCIQHYYSGTDKDGNKISRNDVLEAYINDKGYEVTYEHTLVELVREQGGRVTGAIFQMADGSYMQINAAKGVLLTTGGYPANYDMAMALNPVIDRCNTLAYYSPNDTGDGIKAAMWVGAAKDQDGAAMIFDRGAVAPGVDAGYMLDGDKHVFPGVGKQFNLGSQPLMKVDRSGRRFVNESTPYDFCCHAAAEHEGGVFCQVFDSNLKEDVKRFATVGCSKQTQQLLADQADTPLEEIYADQLDAGVMFKADTLEELGGMLGFAGDQLTAFLDECDRYNGFYDAQEDTDFGKEPYRLSELRTAPFFGGWFGGSLLTTVDGIRINEDMQVLDTDGYIIDGLYAAGDCSGSIFGNNYPEYIVGCACGRTLTFSRHAVRVIAGDLAPVANSVYAADFAGASANVSGESGSASTSAAGSAAASKSGSAAASGSKSGSASAAAGSYKDGTYTGTGTGMGGKINVTLEISGGKITVTDISPNNETKGIGGYEAIQDGTFKSQIEAAQSADIEGVSGASVTSAAIKKAVQAALDQAAA